MSTHKKFSWRNKKNHPRVRPNKKICVFTLNDPTLPNFPGETAIKK